MFHKKFYSNHQILMERFENCYDLCPYDVINDTDGDSVCDSVGQCDGENHFNDFNFAIKNTNLHVANSNLLKEES